MSAKITGPLMALAAFVTTAGVFSADALFNRLEQRKEAAASPVPLYRLVLDTTTDEYVVDHGLTWEDCAGEAKEGQAKAPEVEYLCQQQ